MSTWIDDLKRTDPKLAEAYGVVGNQDRQSLRSMVRALTLFMNTRPISVEDRKRLQAARYILRHTKGN